MSTLDGAVAALRPTDTLGIPLGPGQPVAFLEALGGREDWVDLKVYGALLTVFTELFSHPNVHYLSGFFGPLDRILRDQGANIGFAPADFRQFVPLLEQQRPRVMCTAASPPDSDGWCSLSLHAGAHVGELHGAGADDDRLLVVEVSPRYPRTHGLPPDHRHALHVDEIDLLIESDREPITTEDPPPSDVERAIARHVRTFVPDGATLQTGIGAVPSMVAALLAEGDGGGYGIHSEMFTTGLMRLHQAGKVVNRKGQYDGVSVCTFAAGTRELYDWLDDNHEVAFVPVGLVNSPEAISRNSRMVTINAALAVDVHGQVVADTIGGTQFSGIGGAEDFAAGAALELEDRGILCLPSTYTAKDGSVRSRIVPWFEAGTVITNPRHMVDVIVTEHGAAELAGKTVHQRGEALAAIAAPQFRDELLAAAARASRGRSPLG
ncbi:MAG TPA: acetyl-CoA hydrolase/transferase C-terminal domain-containing protein [Acidimicrobiales bacterium]|nr:acetyl-CoA hydrolase/transferase C-terminal domain-containing protein [Acidimicrobiales bacterium]